MTESTSGHATRNDVGDKRAEVDWQEAHAALVRLARSRAGLDFDEGVWLLAALRSEAHVRLGYGSFVEYTERIFGYAPRLTQESCASPSRSKACRGWPRRFAMGPRAGRACAS